MASPSAIAHYRINEKIGEGGMGEVYKATDTKLGRDVAIKVLPASLATNPDRMARFSREAQVLASLNHPNIAYIYGVADAALIMELIEGLTLEQRMRKVVYLPRRRARRSSRLEARDVKITSGPEERWPSIFRMTGRPWLKPIARNEIVRRARLPPPGPLGGRRAGSPDAMECQLHS